MQRNLNLFDRLTHVKLGAIFIFLGMFVYHMLFARFLMSVLGLVLLAEGLFASCILFAKMGIRSEGKSSASGAALLALLAIQTALAYEWFMAGWEKITDPKFFAGFSGTIAFFASKNPFAWYAWFLNGFVTHYASAFAIMASWGEFLVGIGAFLAVAVAVCAKRGNEKRLAAILSAVVLMFGAFMNMNYFFAAGWTGSGTKGVNVIMFWTEWALVYYWLRTLI